MRHLALVLALAALVAAGCNLLGHSNDDEEIPTPQPENERSTPEGLLAYFASVQANSARDLDGLWACLHPDFRFHFTAGDQEGDPHIPESWNKAYFIFAMGNMFEQAVTMSFDFTLADTLASAPCDTSDASPLCQFYEVVVQMAVEVPTEPENITYLVYGLADLGVTQEESGSGLWVIHEIVDRTAEIGGGGAAPAAVLDRVSCLAGNDHSRGLLGGEEAVENTSWGHVLALFD